MRFVPAIALSLTLAILPGCSSERSRDPDQIEMKLRQGEEALSFFDFNRARQLLAEVQPHLQPGSDQWVEATYALGLASWHSSPSTSAFINQAEALFEALIAARPESDFALQARIDLGRIDEIRDYRGDAVQIDRARERWREVMDLSPGTDFGYQAMLRLAQTYAQTLDFAEVQEATLIISNYLEKYPDSAWVSVAAQYLGDLYADYLDELEPALEAYQIAHQRGFANRARADLYVWRMAEFARRLDQQHLAVDYYQEILEKYPRSMFGTLARDHLREYVKQYPDSGLVVPELTGFKPQS